MKTNPNEKSTFSFKEMLENKESKKEYLMPPPRTPLRSVQNYIQELRKNLAGNPHNIQQNLQLQEELNKIKLMNKESIYNSNNIYNASSMIHGMNNIINNTYNESEVTDFETGINNNSHNDININLEEDQLNCSLDNSKDKEKDKDKDKEKENFIKFDKFPTPKNKTEIKFFFTNLSCYINSLLSSNSFKNNNKLYDELLIFKYKLETRYNDYRNRGLNEQYFINILNQNQEELINIMGTGIKNEKKEDSLNSSNLNNIINIHSNYSFIGKKRKKSLSEIRSITDGSSSYEDGDLQE